MSISFRWFRPTFVLAAVALAAAPALAEVPGAEDVPAPVGPPWISVEYPANPFDAATRGALAIVHTYHHGVSRPFPLRVHAEGVVRGERRTVQLEARETSRTGVWAVTGRLPEGTGWVISATMTDTDKRAMGTALIGIAPDGRLAAVEVPLTRQGNLAYPREASRADIDAVLAAAQGAAPRGVHASKGALLLLLLAPAALAGRRRRERRDP
jgi:hypothetical protein